MSADALISPMPTLRAGDEPARAPRGAGPAGGLAARGRVTPDDHHVGGAQFRQPVRDHVIDGRHGAHRPGRRGGAGHRRGVPGHRLPLCRDAGDARRGSREVPRPDQPHHRLARADRRRSRTPSTAETCSAPTPTAAASCARCCRWTARWRATTPGDRGCAATTRSPGRAPRSSTGTVATAWSRSIPWPAGRSPTSTTTSRGTTSSPTRCSSDGFASVGCFPCTRRTGSGEDSRGGRWAGKDKNECGIHVVAPA